jgi:hypothetical protein
VGVVGDWIGSGHIAASHLVGSPSATTLALIWRHTGCFSCGYSLGHWGVGAGAASGCRGLASSCPFPRLGGAMRLRVSFRRRAGQARSGHLKATRGPDLIALSNAPSPLSHSVGGVTTTPTSGFRVGQVDQLDEISSARGLADAITAPVVMIVASSRAKPERRGVLPSYPPRPISPRTHSPQAASQLVRRSPKIPLLRLP